jgi:hypothetical protein
MESVSVRCLKQVHTGYRNGECIKTLSRALVKQSSTELESVSFHCLKPRSQYRDRKSITSLSKAIVTQSTDMESVLKHCLKPRSHTEYRDEECISSLSKAPVIQSTDRECISSMSKPLSEYRGGECISSLCKFPDKHCKEGKECISSPSKFQVTHSKEKGKV